MPDLATKLRGNPVGRERLTARGLTARGLPPITWRNALIAVVVGVVAAINLQLALSTFLALTPPARTFDWTTYLHAGSLAGSPALYDTPYRWSPLLAWTLPAITALGLPLWRFLHVAALALLPRRLALLALLSYPFWYDVTAGNVMTLVVVVGAAALAGKRWGIAGFLVLAVLIPRPLMLPVVVWLLWKRPEWRLPFVGMVVFHGLAVLATGLGDEWVTSVLTASGEELTGFANVAPTRWIGAWWLLIAWPLAAWLTVKGRLGLASLAMQPYWLPYYLLVLLWELAPVKPTRSSVMSDRKRRGNATTAEMAAASGP